MNEHLYRTQAPLMTVVTVALAIAAVGLMAAHAYAGTYAIDNCPSAPTGNDNPGPWMVFGSPQSDDGSCSGGVGSWIGPLGGVMNPNTADGVEAKVPPDSGITIREAKIWWSVPQATSGAPNYPLGIADDNTVIGGDEPYDRSKTPDDVVLPSTTTTFALEDYCSSGDGPNGCTFGAGENPNLQLYGAQLTLADPGLPTATTTGGSLATPGPVSGTESLAYNAQDTGSGVRALELLLDGQAVAKNDYIAQCPYQNFAACPTSLSDAIAWNTASAANGAHELALRVVNAAGNASIVDEHTITVENPLLGGLPANALAHVANGQSPCAGAALSLTVNGHAVPPAIPYGRAVTVTGRLHCGAVPIRNARVQIATAASPPAAAIATGVQTDRDGAFSYAVPRGPDRRLRFSYIAYSDDPAPAATATATISVRAKIALHIAPRLLRNDHTMRWSGTIGPGPYPRQGTTLLVEVREGTHWKAFDQVVANARGRFAYAYTFHSTFEPTTYTFRVALPKTGAQDYPYAPTSSNTVNVHVRP